MEQSHHRVVIQSFEASGISNNTDRSEDNMIHYLKPGEVAHSAAGTVAKETTQPNNTVACDDEHSFISIDDEDLVWKWRKTRLS